LLISVCVARPDVPTPVSVRVPNVQISEAVRDPPPTVDIATSIFVASTFPIEPAVERLDVAAPQTAVATSPGIAEIDPTIEASVDPRDEDAFRTVVLTPEMFVARDEDAFKILALAVVIDEPSDVEAFVTLVSTPEIAEARDVEAFRT
jgi:hypothetical protein